MSPDELQRVAHEFLEAMQACVRSVDYERARPLFAEDVVAFGTFAAVVTGRDRLKREQWHNIWPTIRDFTFVMDTLHCLGDSNALCVVVAWDSRGRRADGSTFPRPGRATLLLEPRNGHWVATHSHFSQAPVRPTPGPHP